MTQKKEILFVSTYTPRGGKIALYSHELVKAMIQKFDDSFSINVCAIESGKISYNYSEEVKWKLQTKDYKQYIITAEKINRNKKIKIVCLQHDFDLFEGEFGENILYFLYTLTKPIIVTFHTVLEKPKIICKQLVTGIIAVSEKIVVTNKYDAEVLKNEYRSEERRVG